MFRLKILHRFSTVEGTGGHDCWQANPVPVQSFSAAMLLQYM